MAGPKDIRREIGDIQPNNYVRPGVENHAIGDAIKAVVGGGLAIDSAVQTEKLAEQLDGARARFITGSPATAEAMQESDDDLDARVESELKPLRDMLSGKKRAADQGTITAARFQLESDAIVQRAIASRPGLAPEFRQLHAEYTGGALIEALTQREADMLRTHLSEAETAAKQAEDTMKFRLEVLKDSGFAAEAGAAAGNPQAVEALYLSKYQDMARYHKRQADATFYKNTVSQVDSQDSLDRPAKAQAWTATFDLSMENIARSVRAIQPQLQAANEEQFAGLVNEFDAVVSKQIASLESERVALKLSPEDVSERIAVLKQYREDAKQFLDGTVALDQRKKRSETWLLVHEARLREDEPLLAMLAGAEKMGGPVFAAKLAELSNTMASQTKVEWAKFLQEGSARPEAISPLAGGMAAAMLKDVFPQGTQTDMSQIKALPEAMSVLTNMGNAFIVLPNDKFKAKDFSSWVGELSFYSEVLGEKVPDEQKQQLAWSIAGAANKGIRVGMIQLMQDHPGLKNQLRGNPDFGSDDAIAFKTGYKPTAVEQNAVDMANTQLGHGTVLGLLKSLSGSSTMKDAGKMVWEASEIVRGQENLAKASQKPSKPRQGGGGGGSTGVGARKPSQGHTGATERWWE